MEFTEILQIIKNPRILSEQELSSISSDVYDYLYNERTSYELFLLWDEYFKNINFDQNIVLGLSDTFFQWYSIVFFKNFDRLDPNHIASILPFTFMMGFYLDLDVSYIYIDYLMTYIPEDKEQTKIHKIIVQKVAQLNLPFDYKKGMAIKDLIALKLDQEITNIHDDDIERSKIRGSVEEFLSQNDFFNLKSSEQKVEIMAKLFLFLNFLSDPDGVEKVRSHYLESADYLTAVKEDGVVDWLFDAYFKVYGNPVLEEMKAKEIEEDSVENNNIETVIGADVDSVGEENNISNPEISKYSFIKSELEQQFSYDEAGELQPLEEVLARLSQLAEENNDENIEELYMFDENEGKFIWNEELLSTK